MRHHAWTVLKWTEYSGESFRAAITASAWGRICRAIRKTWSAPTLGPLAMKGIRLALLAMCWLPIAVGCSTPSQWQIDAEVRRLCAIDGGVKVYETVDLKGLSNQALRVPTKEDMQESDVFYYEWIVQYIQREINADKVDLARSHFRLFRAADNKLIGESVAYTRRGGDIPGPWNPSHFTCPVDSGLSILKSRVFSSSDGVK